MMTLSEGVPREKAPRCSYAPAATASEKASVMRPSAAADCDDDVSASWGLGQVGYRLLHQCCTAAMGRAAADADHA